MGKKIKKMVITTGIVGLMLFGMTGCSKGEVIETSAPVQTEATTEADLDVRINLETTEVDINNETVKAEVYETDAEGGFVGKTEGGEVLASMGRYGEYGKEAYDLLVADWVDWIYADEGELRLNATAMLGSISEENYEAIIAEILSIDRGSNPYADLQTEAQSIQSESKPVQSTQSESKSSNTNIVTETKSQQSESTPPPQPAPTQPAPEQQLAPGALSEEEIARRESEAGMGQNGNGGSVLEGPIHLDPGAGQGYDWN